VKKILIFLILFMTTCIPVNAEIKRDFDQFKNTFTVYSERSVKLNERLEVVGTFSKTYYAERPTIPSYSLLIAFIGDRYYFLSRDFSYLIDGEEMGHTERWSFGNDSYPTKPVVHSWKAKIIFPELHFFKSVQAGKTLKLRLYFDNVSPIVLPIGEEAIKEWQEVIKFDLHAEIKKLPQKQQ
jgi:hypothetical protein